MDLRERIASVMGQARPELAELVAIRSVADPRQFPPEECARAAQWVLDAFARVGLLRRPAGGDGGREPRRARDPAEIATMALTEALFLQRYAAIRGGSSEHGLA
jgi:acetylornithine deacetylase/succinyl-diaminopimelate desuccinylase-like protein